MGILPIILQEEWMILEDVNTKHYERSMRKHFFNKIKINYGRS